MKYLWILGLLLLTGCGTARDDLRIMSSSPASVAVYGRSNPCLSCDQTAPVSDEQMAAIAEEHCAKHGRVPRRVYEGEAPRGRTIVFDCVKVE